ncbi:MAG: alpha/beta fold hydrolase [Acidimicrobiales bacterium]
MPDPFHARLQVPVAGGALGVAVAGPASGRPVVLAVHGLAATHRWWGPVARHLGDDVTLVAADLRGRGASADLPGPFGLAAHVDDLLAVLDHLGVVSAVLAGHDLGAHVVAGLAGRRPERAAALVLVDGGLPLPVLPDATDPEAVFGPSLDRVRRTFASRHDHVSWWRRHPAFGDEGAWTEELEAALADDLVGTAPALRPAVAEKAVGHDGRELLGDDAVRTTLARAGTAGVLLRAPRGVGDGDPLLLPDPLVAEWVATTPGLVEEVVPDTNHSRILVGDREAATVAERIRRAAGLGG